MNYLCFLQQLRSKISSLSQARKEVMQLLLMWRPKRFPHCPFVLSFGIALVIPRCKGRPQKEIKRSDECIQICAQTGISVQTFFWSAVDQLAHEGVNHLVLKPANRIMAVVM